MCGMNRGSVRADTHSYDQSDRRGAGIFSSQTNQTQALSSPIREDVPLRVFGHELHRGKHTCSHITRALPERRPSVPQEPEAETGNASDERKIHRQGARTRQPGGEITPGMAQEARAADQTSTDGYVR
eukprot:1194529-Prorocentrum_minimum.AAC.6